MQSLDASHCGRLPLLLFLRGRYAYREHRADLPFHGCPPAEHERARGAALSGAAFPDAAKGCVRPCQQSVLRPPRLAAAHACRRPGASQSRAFDAAVLRLLGLPAGFRAGVPVADRLGQLPLVRRVQPFMAAAARAALPGRDGTRHGCTHSLCGFLLPRGCVLRKRHSGAGRGVAGLCRSRLFLLQAPPGLVAVAGACVDARRLCLYDVRSGGDRKQVRRDDASRAACKLCRDGAHVSALLAAARQLRCFLCAGSLSKGRSENAAFVAGAAVRVAGGAVCADLRHVLCGAEHAHRAGAAAVIRRRAAGKAL